MNDWCLGFRVNTVGMLTDITRQRGSQLSLFEEFRFRVIVPPHSPHRTVVDESTVEFPMVPCVAKDINVGHFDDFAILQTVEANEDIMLGEMGDRDALVADLGIDHTATPHVVSRVSNRR